MQSFIGNTQSNIKGHVRLSLKGDNSKFLLFLITSIGDNEASNNFILNVNIASFSESNPFSVNVDNDLLVSFAMVGTKGEKGDKGATGADSTVPGPRGPTGDASTVPGPTGPTGADSTVPGPRGPTGADSTVPGPRGPTGADSTVPGPTGPTGADSTVPGPIGPTGADSTVPGPRGPTGPASTVPGPRGPTGPASIPGPRGPTGAASTVPGPAGATGSAGVDSNSFKWRFTQDGGGGYGQFGRGNFVARTSSGYSNNKYGLAGLWVNKQDIFDTIVGTGASTSGGRPTGWFGLWDNGDIINCKKCQ